MTMALKMTFTSPVCALLIVLCSSPGLSTPLLLLPQQDDVIVIENRPFKLQCSLTGTDEELKGKTITWSGQDPDDDSRLLPVTGTGNDGIITTERSPGKMTSILNVPKLPNVTFIPNYLYYQCNVPKTASQFTFVMRLVREDAVPQISPFEAKTVEVGTKVYLNCTISYHNDNFRAEYKLNLSWKKDGSAFKTKSCLYGYGKRTCLVAGSVEIKSFKDGGNYTCEWTLGLQDDYDSIMGRRIQTIGVSAYLRGPAEKEVNDTAGSDVKLHCDVIGFPITYEWQYEDGIKIVDNNGIKVKDNVVAIDDIDYDDQKKYFCSGIVNGTDVQQVIILRVKGSAASGTFRNITGLDEPSGLDCGTEESPPGPVGSPGSLGLPGYPGMRGRKGEPMTSTFLKPPPGRECRCPMGPKGSEGVPGMPGPQGNDGTLGYPGHRGAKGELGLPGLPGKRGAPAPPLPRYPPNNSDTMFIPVAFNGKVPRAMCQHVRRQAYVPGAPQHWLGWYETGKSGYLTFDKWLYFSSRFQCPCSIPTPPGPTPSAEALLRLL